MTYHKHGGEPEPVEIRYYQAANRRRPFQEWLDSLDSTVQQIVAARLARVRRGLFGNMESVGKGVFELKLDAGPGYRIYFGRDGKVFVLLLNAGQKKGQSADIKRAQVYWQDYLRRKEK